MLVCTTPVWNCYLIDLRWYPADNSNRAAKRGGSRDRRRGVAQNDGWSLVQLECVIIHVDIFTFSSACYHSYVLIFVVSRTINKNNITTLPRDVFSGMNKLRITYVSGPSNALPLTTRQWLAAVAALVPRTWTAIVLLLYMSFQQKR